MHELLQIDKIVTVEIQNSKESLAYDTRKLRVLYKRLRVSNYIMENFVTKICQRLCSEMAFRNNHACLLLKWKAY